MADREAIEPASCGRTSCPAWTAVGVTDLYNAEGIVEIAVIAVVRQDVDALITR